MNRGELTTEIEAILGNREDLESRIHTWLNIAIRRIARLYPFPELCKIAENCQTVAGQKSYSASSDFGLSNLHVIHTVRLIHGASSWKLRYQPSRVLDSNEARPESYANGKPRIYTLWGTVLEFIDLIPDDAYTLYIRYVVWPTEMSNNSDYPSITGIDDLIIAATCAWGYATLQENEDSNYWAEITKGLWSEVLKDLQDRPDYIPKMRGFLPTQGLIGEYWNNPFIRGINNGI